MMEPINEDIRLVICKLHKNVMQIDEEDEVLCARCEQNQVILRRFKDQHLAVQTLGSYEP